jgi:hypothetical protein
MMSNQQQRIAELEAQVRDLQSQLAALKSAAKPSQVEQRRAETSVRVLTLDQSVCDLPNDDEADRLLAMVLVRWPQLMLAPGRAQERRDSFRAALHYLTFYRRSDKLNTGVAVAAFADEYNTWLKGQRGLRCFDHVTSRLLYSACIVQGILYAPPTRYPYDLALGLTAHSTTSRPAPAVWRDTLNNSRLPEPTPLPRPASLPPLETPHPRVFGGPY